MVIVLIIVLIVLFLFIGGAEIERKDLIEFNKFKHGIDTTRTERIKASKSKYEGASILPP